MQAAAPRAGRPSLRRCGSGIKESTRDHCAYSDLGAEKTCSAIGRGRSGH
jgi:hypothetical protein